MSQKVWPSTISIILIALCCGFQKANEWARFTSKEGNFTILMPARPSPSVSNNQVFSDHSFTVDTNWSTFQVGYSDYQATLSDPEKALDGARNALLQSVNAKLLRETKLKPRGHVGRELVVVADGGMALDKIRLYIVGNRMYRIRVVATSASKADAPDADKFFSSFEINEERKR